MQKVSATVGEGAIDTWDPNPVAKLIQPGSKLVDELSDSDSIVEESDSIVESGDEESFAHSSFDEPEKPVPAPNRTKAQRPKRKSNRVEAQKPKQSRHPDTSTQSEPKIKKRDKCVIS